MCALSLAHTHTHLSLCLSLSDTHTHTVDLFNTHTQTHSLTHTPLAHTLSLTHSLSLAYPRHDVVERDWYYVAELSAPVPHLVSPKGRAALRILLLTVPNGSRSCENFLDGFDLHLLQGR